MTYRFRSVEVCTGSRLHFGLTSIGTTKQPCFGGLGVMIDKPETRIVIKPANRFVAKGSRRVRELAEIWRKGQSNGPLKCQIDEVRSPAAHVGLGSGTQLALAIGAGLTRFFGCPELSPSELAQRMHRGGRSAIGTFGFYHGGLIVDQRLPNDSSALNLAHQINVPNSWRLILVRSKNFYGCHGREEINAFAQLDTQSDLLTYELNELIRTSILPAARAEEFDVFCEAIHDYGALSGEYFRTVQGGTYNGPLTAAVIQSIRDLGVKGVGQSSWGPVVFAWCRNELEADRLYDAISSMWREHAEIWTSGVRNCGATITSGIAEQPEHSTEIKVS